MLPAASVAVQVTVVSPLVNRVFDAGSQVTVRVSPELSVTDSPLYVTTADVLPASYSTDRSAGQVTAGAVVSA